MKGALARTPPRAHTAAAAAAAATASAAAADSAAAAAAATASAAAADSAAAAADSDECADAAAAPVITSPLPAQQRHSAPQAVSPSAQILSWRETMKEILHHTRKQ